MTRYNFDEIIDRSGTHDVKHEALLSLYGRTDLLPLWVADMDFATPPFVLDAMRRRLDHPIMGYTVFPPAYWQSLIDWLQHQHQWTVKKEWLSYIPGIVKGIGLVVNALLRPDEKVIIQPPVYHPFRLVPQGNHREVVFNPLKLSDDGRYEMDFEQLESVCDEKCRLLILSNPHNPAGQFWPAATLRRLADFCYEHHITVISDEIHCDMPLFGHRHTPFATVSERAADISITFQAPTKTFNMAGVVTSFAIVPNAELRQQFYGWLKANEFESAHLLAPIATMAAYSDEGETWRKQLTTYLEGNVEYVENYCKTSIPQVIARRPEASYLVWLDCRRLNLNHAELVDLFVNRARLALNDGEMFGPEGAGFMRMNIGVPRQVLHQALQQLAAAVNGLSH